MNCEQMRHIDDLIQRYPQLESARQAICAAYHCIEACYENGGKLLIAGNGGSAADAEHIVGELMKGFRLPRGIAPKDQEQLLQADVQIGTVLAQNLQGALPAIALTGHPALATAYMNDCNAKLYFAQQVYGLGKAEDVLLCISTSGNSENILYAAVAAKAKGMKVVGLTGGSENRLMALADHCICAPQTETYKIQELHLPIYHCLCVMLEERFFQTKGGQNQ